VLTSIVGGATDLSGNGSRQELITMRTIVLDIKPVVRTDRNRRHWNPWDFKDNGAGHNKK
jgi:hypothetical protein